MKIYVIKTINMEVTKKFYEDIGCVFTEEKHGKGPKHYSASIARGNLLEIYPGKKNSLTVRED